MHIKSLQLKSIGPFDAFEVRPKTLTVIRGPNGAGKTTIVNAVRYLGEKNHDPSLIKGWPNLADGAFGEIRLVIADPGHEYDGANFVCTITADRTTRVLHHPKLGKIPIAKSKEWIEGVINMISLDPVRFLTASDKEQVQIFLQAQPLRVTADQLGFLPVGSLKGVDLDKHALEVLGDKNNGIYGSLYEQRAGINAEAKTKGAYAVQLAATLPEDAPEGNWGDELNRITAKFRDLQKRTTKAISDTKADCAKNDSAIRGKHSSHIEAVEAEREKRIESLRISAQMEIETSEQQRDLECKDLETIRDKALDKLEAEYRPANKKLTDAMAQAKAMVEQHAKAAAIRDMIGQAQSDAMSAEAKSACITKALKLIEALKVDMLKATPIPGLEIANGSLVLDGVVLKRVNDAKKSLKVALQIGRLQAGPLGFIVMDNAEKFDEDQWPIVEQVALELGMQVMATRATARDKEGKRIEGISIETESRGGLIGEQPNGTLRLEKIEPESDLF